MKQTYSRLVSESPIVYHIWYYRGDVNSLDNIPPSIIATEISDTVTEMQIKQQKSLIDTENMYIILNNTIRVSTVNKHRQEESGYLENGTGIKIQNIIMNFDNKFDKTRTVDHINNNRLDNRKCNLRLATLSTQMRNRKCKKVPQSGHRGITKHGLKYDVTFTYDKKRYRAYFYDLQDAINWRDMKMREVIPAAELLEWRDLQDVQQPLSDQ